MFFLVLLRLRVTENTPCLNWIQLKLSPRPNPFCILKVHEIPLLLGCWFCPSHYSRGKQYSTLDGKQILWVVFHTWNKNNLVVKNNRWVSKNSRGRGKIFIIFFLFKKMLYFIKIIKKKILPWKIFCPLPPINIYSAPWIFQNNPLLSYYFIYFFIYKNIRGWANWPPPPPPLVTTHHNIWK